MSKRAYNYKNLLTRGLNNYKKDLSSKLQCPRGEYNINQLNGKFYISINYKQIINTDKLIFNSQFKVLFVHKD